MVTVQLESILHAQIPPNTIIACFLADQTFPLNRRGPGDTLLVAVGETREKGARSANYQEKKTGRKRIKKRGEKRCFLRVGDCFFDIKTCFLYVFPPRKSLVLGL